MRLALALSLGLATAAPAQELMSPEDFDAWSTGHTLDYYLGTEYWGSEAHYSGRSTMDKVEDVCLPGTWVAQGDAICFEYGTDDRFCWYFWRDGDTVTAKTTDAAPETPPYTVTLSDTPLNCPGPDVGV